MENKTVKITSFMTFIFILLTISASIMAAAEDRLYSNEQANRAQTLADENRHREAIERWNEAILNASTGKERALYYYGRSKSFEKSGDLRNAIEDCRKGIDLEPNNPEMYYYRGRLYMYTRSHKRAVKDFSMALNKGIRDRSAVYSYRGWAYVILRDFQNAIKDHDKVVELSPENGKSYQNRGSMYAAMNDHEKAIENYRKAIELGAGSDPYYLRALVFHEIGSEGRAKNDFIKAAQLGHKQAQEILKKNNIDY